MAVQRYVMGVEARVPLDDDGFLVPEPSRIWSGGRPRRVEGLLDDGVSFVLLAAGGVGKTRTLSALCARERGAVFLPAGVLTRGQLEVHLDDIGGRGVPGYLDGLDQAASVDARLLSWLETVLTSGERRGLPWRLGCRSAAWDSALAASLSRELAGFQVWKLLPLDRAAAAEVLTDVGYDGEAFVRELVRARLGRLSACVGRLLAAARYWHEHGVLPSGPVQAISYEIKGLLQEWDTRLRPVWPQDRAQRIAKRLAGFSMFSGRTTLSAEPAVGSATLSAADLPSDPEPDEPGRPVEPADYRDVLGTALFDPAYSACVAFRHQTYEEYLAAAFLIDRRAVPEQVSVLLGVTTHGVLPTARIGVAAWLAALKPALVESVMERNALAFASSMSTVGLPSDSARATVVEGLLRSAAAEEQRPDWQVDLAGLRHDGLEKNLVTRLDTGISSTEELWWIARLTAACRCVRAVSGLLSAAHDRRWFAYGRRAAAVAVSELGDDDQRRALIDIVGDGDEDGEVLAAVIDALYPRLMTTSELTVILQPARTDMLGAYRMTLNGLAERIPCGDLAEFGRWLAATLTDVGDARRFHNLLSAIVTQMWAAADDDDTRAALAELLLSSERTGLWYSHEHPGSAPWSSGDSNVARRHALALNLTHLTGDDSCYAILSLDLLVPADLPWLLKEVNQTSPSQALLLRCLPHLAGNPETAAAADLILDMDPSHPAYAITSWCRGASLIDATEFANRRRVLAQQRELAEWLVDRDQRHAAALRSAIGWLGDDPLSWWRVATLLAASDESEELCNHDLTTRSLWATLTPADQDLIFDAGVRYLNVHLPQAHTWCTSEQVTDAQAMPDWAGVHLMSTILRHRPEQLSSLNHAVWEAWAHAIVATWHLTEATSEARLDLVEFAMTVHPEALVNAAVRHLDELQGAGKPLAPHRVYERLAVSTRERFADELANARYRGEVGSSLLEIIVRYAPWRGAELCRRITSNPQHPLRRQALTHLAALDPNEIVNYLDSPTLDNDEKEMLAGRLDIPGLDLIHLERAADLLLDLCPPHTDPPLSAGRTFGEISQPRQARRQALERLALEGHVDALERLRHGKLDFDQRVIAAELHIARTRQADLTLTTVQPASLLQLLRCADARLIRDDADLQQVIITQLDALQHQIKHNNAHRDIWNGDTPQSEDDISDWIRRRLEERVTSALLIDREPQVSRPSNRGVGTRIDLTATATTTLTRNIARVVIEAKHHSNRELTTAMRDQLVDRYLVPTGHIYGIYLTYWTAPDQRPRRWSKSAWANQRDLLQKLETQAAELAQEGWRIRPYVLDISHP